MNAAQSFGQYKLVSQIAEGGMGEIYLAADTQLNQPVVIKRVLSKFRTRPDVARMFEAEATVMSVLRHPNIVRIFESGEVDGVFYIAMEYIHGKTLRQLVDRSRAVGEAIPPALVIDIVSRLSRALAYAHEMRGRSGQPMGLVHRDVNPSNLLLGYDGSVKLIDFGIVQTDDELAPEELAPKGKFAYMSPEQTREGSVDLRSDLFSLGICLYEALTLYNPFIHEAQGTDAVEAIQTHQHSAVSRRDQRLEPFDAVLSQLLEKDAEKRFANGTVLANVLESLARLYPNPVPLSPFLRSLFDTQKAQEDATLEAVELSAKSTVTVRGSAPPSKQTPPPLPPRHDDTAADLPVPELTTLQTQGSSALFAALLVLIVGASSVGALMVYHSVLEDRLAQAASIEIIEVEEPSRPVDTPPAIPELSAGEDARTRADVDPALPNRDPRTVARSEKDASLASRSEQKAKQGKDRPLATLSMVTDPSVRMEHDGTRFSRTDSVELFESQGTITVGRGRHVTRDPFTVTVEYTVEEGQLTLSIATEPWAIIRGPQGSNLGRTPVLFKAKPGTASFELTNPREGRLMRMVLRFNPLRTRGG